MDQSLGSLYVWKCEITLRLSSTPWYEIPMALLVSLPKERYVFIRSQGMTWETVTELSTNEKIDRILQFFDVSLPLPKSSEQWTPCWVEATIDVRRIALDTNKQSTLMFRRVTFQAMCGHLYRLGDTGSVNDFFTWHEVLQTQLSLHLQLHRCDPNTVERYNQVERVMYIPRYININRINPFAHFAISQSLRTIYPNYLIHRADLELITSPLKEFFRLPGGDLKVV